MFKRTKPNVAEGGDIISESVRKKYALTIYDSNVEDHGVSTASPTQPSKELPMYKPFPQMTELDKNLAYETYRNNVIVSNQTCFHQQVPLDKDMFLGILQRSEDRKADGVNQQFYINEAFKHLMATAEPILTKDRELSTLTREEKEWLYLAYKNEQSKLNMMTKYFFIIMEKEKFEELMIPRLKEELDEERFNQAIEPLMNELHDIVKGDQANSLPNTLKDMREHQAAQEAKRSPLITDMGNGVELFAGYRFVNGFVEDAPHSLTGKFQSDMAVFQNRVSLVVTGQLLQVGQCLGDAPRTVVKKETYFENIEADYRTRGLIIIINVLNDFKTLVEKIKALNFTGAEIDKAASLVFLYDREVKSMGAFVTVLKTEIARTDVNEMQLLTTAVEFFRWMSMLKRSKLFSGQPYNSESFEVELSFDSTPKQRFVHELKTRVKLLSVLVSVLKHEMQDMKNRSAVLLRVFQDIQREYDNEVEKTR